MAAVWSEQRKLEIWLKIELLTAEALAAQGVVPPEDFQRMKERAGFEIQRCKEWEQTLHHDVVAFTATVAERIGEPANRWLHFGLTSSDVVDTALAVQMVEAADLLLSEMDALLGVIREKALRYKMTPMIGRSHGIHAEPTTFGLKMAVMFDEFVRGRERLSAVRKRVAVGKASGAVGTNAHLSPEVEDFVCRRLDLRPARVATQIVQRDRHAEFLTTLALVGSSIERWATEFRHLQRTEVLEVEESFSQGQKGSSAMPHKRNPITGERLSGLARVLRGNAVAAMEDVALWHERDISHSSVERIIFPDGCILLDYMLATLRTLTAGLVVYPESMKKNLKLSLGLWHSQGVLLALVRKGLTREKAYEWIQRNAMETWKAQREGRSEADFKSRLRSDPDLGPYFEADELDRLCSLEPHLRYVDAKFRAVGILPRERPERP